MENNQIETDSWKVKDIEIKSDGEIVITYRDMTPEEIEMGQFFKKFMEGMETTNSTRQSSAIVKYNNEV
jgi:hypothetical protein